MTLGTSQQARKLEEARDLGNAFLASVSQAELSTALERHWVYVRRCRSSGPQGEPG